MLFLVALAAWGQAASAYTANKIWLELRPNGRFRVNVDYTVPELKERRLAYVEFSHKKDADQYYFNLLRGADFYVPDAKEIEFKQPPLQPEPW